MQFQGKETAVCGRSSSGRAPPCQGGGSEFEPRRPLQTNSKEPVYAGFLLIMVTWPSGKARVCKTLIRQFKSARHLHKPVTKKMSQAFFFAVSSKNGDFANRFLDAVLQCCPIISGRFSQLDAHFSCRFPEFGRGGGNFFEKKQNKSCCFQNVSISPQPISHWLRGFSVFLQLLAKWELPALSFRSPLCECVAGSQIGHLLCKDCKFLIRVRRCHTIRITRKASPPCVPAGKTVQWTIFVKGTYRVVTKCDYSFSLRCKETK